MAHKTTQTEWEENMCEKILPLVRDQLYLDFRYLDTALNTLIFQARPELHTFATDGICLYYSTEQILRLYPDNPLFLNRAYLHSVFHCIFRHLWMRKQRDPDLWNLACDITVEWIIDSLRKPSVSRILSGIRVRLYEDLKEKKIPITAANLYRYLQESGDPVFCQVLAREFVVDDHRLWPRDPASSPSASKAGKKWEQIGRRASQELETRGGEDGEGAQALRTQIKSGRSRRSYAEFLRKFTVLQEELHLDQDSFDPGLYSYGLRLYKNMPLIEPQESREINKIAEFAIVIDTSYSTSGDLVKHFLEKTFEIIRDRDSFFRESRIHIIQCDDRVRADHVISREEEIEPLLAQFDLLGGGSTDFRPAFAYVNQLVEEKTFRNLKGLLYFTDGKGTYPASRPAYRTAFLFLGQEEGPGVPAWAMKPTLDPEDFQQRPGKQQ